jgi:hypothetical protein
VDSKALMLAQMGTAQYEAACKPKLVNVRASVR